LRIQGRAPIRAGAKLFTGDAPVGSVTSGCFGPSADAPVAMGYVAASRSKTGTELQTELRGKRVPVAVCDLPFVPARYKRD